MAGFFDGRCPKCKRSIGWFGEAANNPGCDSCGWKPSAESLLADGDAVAEAERAFTQKWLELWTAILTEGSQEREAYARGLAAGAKYPPIELKPISTLRRQTPDPRALTACQYWLGKDVVSESLIDGHRRGRLYSAWDLGYMGKLPPPSIVVADIGILPAPLETTDAQETP